MEQKFIRGEDRIFIKTPKVKEVAAKYFNCSSVSGVELENEGTSGSAGAHWERVLLFNEMMTASSFDYSSFSEFSFALLIDSGWYEVDLSLAE